MLRAGSSQGIPIDGTVIGGTTPAAGTFTTLQATGNVGIGTTPSAWTTYKTLDINAYASFIGSSGNSGVTNNAFYDGAWKAKNTAAASLYLQTAGKHEWYNAPSVTAGSELTLATAMVLNASGRLLLGTATDNGTDIAQFTGSVASTGAATTLNATAIPAGGTAGSGYKFSSTSNFGVFFGSGAPTLAAAKGSLYLRSDGSGTNDRMYVNTNGSTTWTAVVTVA